MLLTELQTYSLTHLTNNPFSSATSADNSFAFTTEKGLDVLGRIGKTAALWLTCLLVVALLVPTSAEDVTRSMFGDQTSGLPAAFGDFNSDELTDIFMIKDKSRKLEILFGHDKEPVMRSAGPNCSCTFQKMITSVVPGDFNGDALMDVLVTLSDDPKSDLNHVVVLWGDMTRLDCHENTLFKMKDQPQAIDYNGDMTVDLFGLDESNQRSFWIFNGTKNSPRHILMKNDTDHFKGNLRSPHSHAYLDLNDDNIADLYVSAQDNFEIWKGLPEGGFAPLQPVLPLPPNYSKNNQNSEIGQTLFLDLELDGFLDHVCAYCIDYNRCDIAVYAYNNTKLEPKWYNLNVNLHEGPSKIWTFPRSESNKGHHLKTITLRGGDWDMDGYPDIMTTLVNVATKESRSFLLLNTPCSGAACAEFSRTFEVQWNALIPYDNNTVLGVMYDFPLSASLELIFVRYNSASDSYNITAYKNDRDYDANFIKVMVVTGLVNAEHPLVNNPLRNSASVYGTNLPGPKVFYVTTTQEGDPRMAIATQIPQSAHFSLNLPYTIFGLGRTPNFIDSLTVHMYGKERKWTQQIPNSQMVVIPRPIEEPSSWKVQLFVTPSKLIYQSVLALLATCVVISLIIAALYWKERKEDHLERLQEAHRFHFDAM